MTAFVVARVSGLDSRLLQFSVSQRMLEVARSGGEEGELV